MASQVCMKENTLERETVAWRVHTAAAKAKNRT